MIRGITGVGEGNGPYISIHDGFRGLPFWAGFMSGADRLTLDIHPYFSFSAGAADPDPIDTGTGAGAGGTWPSKVCNSWGPSMNQRFALFLLLRRHNSLYMPYTFSRSAFGTTFAGEFSNGINDCGLFLLGVNTPPTSPDCAAWQDASQFTAGTIAGLLQFSMASMDSLRDYFFWTWKVCISLKFIENQFTSTTMSFRLVIHQQELWNLLYGHINLVSKEDG